MAWDGSAPDLPGSAASATDSVSGAAAGGGVDSSAAAAPSADGGVREAVVSASVPQAAGRGRRTVDVWASARGDIGGMDAVRMAAAMPHALRASATTNLGMDELKVRLNCHDPNFGRPCPRPSSALKGRGFDIYTVQHVLQVAMLALRCWMSRMKRVVWDCAGGGDPASVRAGICAAVGHRAGPLRWRFWRRGGKESGRPRLAWWRGSTGTGACPRLEPSGREATGG